MWRIHRMTHAHVEQPWFSCLYVFYVSTFAGSTFPTYLGSSQCTWPSRYVCTVNGKTVPCVDLHSIYLPSLWLMLELTMYLAHLGIDRTAYT